MFYSCYFVMVIVKLNHYKEKVSKLLLLLFHPKVVTRILF